MEVGWDEQVTDVRLRRCPPNSGVSLKVLSALRELTAFIFP